MTDRSPDKPQKPISDMRRFRLLIQICQTLSGESDRVDIRDRTAACSGGSGVSRRMPSVMQHDAPDLASSDGSSHAFLPAGVGCLTTSAFRQ